MPAIRFGRRTVVMGILNVTPDSFSDGGLYDSVSASVARADEMIEHGADIVDIGAESSRPGAEAVGPDEELKRLLPVLEQWQRRPDTAISVDTCKAEVARRALAVGCTMVNDITALRGDEKMVEVVAEAGCQVVLMHMLGTPRTMQENPTYASVVDDILAFFEERVRFATSCGVCEDSIVLDPGIGFGKTVEHNLEILRCLGKFRTLGCPLLVGTSRKSFIGTVLDLPVDDRLEGTAASVAVSIMNGADAVRVHDVKPMARVARMTDAIIGRGEFEWRQPRESFSGPTA